MEAMTANADAYEGIRKEGVPFDADSVPLRVDNCATASLLPHKSDFIGVLVPVRRRIHGIGRSVQRGIMMGTLRLRIEDDNGAMHDILIPELFYVPDATSRLLSPQHWAQKAKDNHPKRHGTWCAMYNDEIILEWDRR